MQNQLKAIINKIRTQYNKTNLCLGVQCVRDNITKTAQQLAKRGVSANFISVCGFIIGMFALNFLAMQMYLWALICILINRYGDALDGAVAQIKGRTVFGVFLDACLDYVFYAAIIFGFALANPGVNAVAAAFLLFGFASSGCALLAYATVAYGKSDTNAGLKESPFYLGGLAQGAETLTAFVIMCVVPAWFAPISVVLGCWCLVKSLLVVSTAYYNFVIAPKGHK